MSGHAEKELSVVIPSYNEASRIGPTIEAIEAYLPKRFSNYEIIVVDDGSCDGTSTVVSELRDLHRRVVLVTNRTNSGKGYAVREGVSLSRGRLILVCDADLSTPIEELEKLLIWVDRGFDIAIGSRALPESEITVRQPWYREGMGKVFNLLVRLFVLGEYRDTQCGFKLFRSEAAQALFRECKLNGFSYDVEVLFRAKKLGCRVKEVPIRWMNERNSKVSILRDPLKMLIELLRIRWELRERSDG